MGDAQIATLSRHSDGPAGGDARGAVDAANGQGVGIGVTHGLGIGRQCAGVVGGVGERVSGIGAQQFQTAGLEAASFGGTAAAGEVEREVLGARGTSLQGRIDRQIASGGQSQMTCSVHSTDRAADRHVAGRAAADVELPGRDPCQFGIAQTQHIAATGHHITAAEVNAHTSGYRPDVQRPAAACVDGGWRGRGVKLQGVGVDGDRLASGAGHQTGT